MSKIKTLTEETFDSEISNQDTVMVEFGAEWCRPCKALEPTLEAVAEEVSYPVFKVDIDDSPTVAKKFGVKSVPTVILFKSGAVHKTSVGSVSKAALLKLGE